MGFALSSLDVPVTKGTSGILVIPEEGVVHTEEYGPCIRCGRCIDICPMGLMPSMLSILSEKGFMKALRNIIYLTVLNAAHARLYALQKGR